LSATCERNCTLSPKSYDVFHKSAWQHGFNTVAYARNGSPGSDTGPEAESDVCDCLVWNDFIVVDGATRCCGGGGVTVINGWHTSSRYCYYCFSRIIVVVGHSRRRHQPPTTSSTHAPSADDPAESGFREPRRFGDHGVARRALRSNRIMVPPLQSWT